MGKPYFFSDSFMDFQTHFSKIEKLSYMNIIHPTKQL